MVNRCELLLALSSGAGGGTAECVQYATGRGVRIVNLWRSRERYKMKNQQEP
jgi:precorrin-6x reductase